VIVVERQNSTFAAILLQEQVNFQIDDEKIRFVLFIMPSH
jgi:hypothetical protein